MRSCIYAVATLWCTLYLNFRRSVNLPHHNRVLSVTFKANNYQKIVKLPLIQNLLYFSCYVVKVTHIRS